MSSNTRVEIAGPTVRADAAWRLIGDTDWVNRLAGNGRLLGLDVATDPEGYPEVHGRFAGPLGPMPFVEQDVGWVVGRAFHQERTYESRLYVRTVYDARLEPDGDDAVRPFVTLDVEPAGVVQRPFVGMGVSKMGRRIAEALARLPRPGEPWQAPQLRSIPGAALPAFERWRQTADPAVVARGIAWIERARPTELQRMRPWHLADLWGVPRDAALVALLHGVTAGALELYWSVRCGRCHASVASTPLLSDLPDHAGCPSCQIGIHTDLGENVEVLLTPHPAVVPRFEERFCTLYPLAAPDLRALFVVGPGGSIAAEVPVERGAWHVDGGGVLGGLRLHVEDGAGAAPVRWSAAGGPSELEVAGSALALELDNPTRRRARVLVSRDGGDLPRVPAAALTTLPAFRRLMGHQVLAPHLRISVRQVAIVFTDLASSTAMYEALGDAGAFAFVRDHFDVLREVVEGRGGVVVKTVGDGLMAAFVDTGAAAGASLDMLARFDAWEGGRIVAPPPGVAPGGTAEVVRTGLRVGAHVGPALVVHSDAAGIDYFGGTVNTAARLQGAADPGEVVWSEALASAAGVSEQAAGAGWAGREGEVTLKGIRAPQRILRLRRRPLTPDTPRPAR